MAKLYTEFYQQKAKEEHIFEADRNVYEYIFNHTSLSVNERLKENTNWEVFYHFSDIRKSVLNWYDFKNNSCLLEIGGEFGALTGLFCDRCRHVTTIEHSMFKAEAIAKRHYTRENLDIYVGEPGEMTFKNKFDYITLIGNLGLIDESFDKADIYSKYLYFLTKWLKPEGKLLLAVENRYGIRYFCGGIGVYVDKPFSGINKYKKGMLGYSFSRQELEDTIKAAGLHSYKFYYPLPDYQFPQMIYTDEYLPKVGLTERLVSYYERTDILVANEEQLYDDLILNHVFPFFANSYLVECAQHAEVSDISYVAVTTDRKEEHAFLTSIHSDKSVKKRSVYPKGQDTVQAIYTNIMDIQAHGLHVVPHSLEQSIDGSLYLRMPYMSDILCSEYLKVLAKQRNAVKFAEIFDKLYDCILCSSEHASGAKNSLLYMGKKLDWGVILKKAYIELIPMNCFIVNGELCFFDQEFVKEYYPAKYIMYRALRNTYIFIHEAQETVPLERMKERYGLTGLWSILEQEDDKFLEDIRNHKVNHPFYSHTLPDQRRIYKNAYILLGKSKKEGDC